VLALGVAGALAKDMEARDILNAVHLAARGIQLMPRTGVAAGPSSPSNGRCEALTSREAEVLALLRAGLSNREVGASLYIAPGTVKAHIKSIYRKVGVRTRPELLSAGRAPAVSLDASRALGVSGREPLERRANGRARGSARFG
jgi:DNA-binding NarL/FixJ family response regulator